MIKFNAVTKRFGDGTVALDDVTFTVDHGEFVFITGHSGSGKTTLMKLLTREYLPTEGDVHFKDIVINDLRSGELAKHRRQIGVVFQDYKLIPDYTVWENVALPLYITNTKEADIESRVSDLLKLVGITDKAYQFPSQLSGGEAQRVGIARALANAPSVIFADEPTGNLDVDATMVIAQLLHKINELGTTILCATHDVSVLEHLKGHRRVQLENGKIVSDTHNKSQTKTEPKVVVKVELETEPEDKPEEKEKVESKDKGEEAIDEKTKKADEVEKDAEEVKPRIKLSLPKLSMPWSKKKAKESDEHHDTNDKKKDDLKIKVEDL